MKEVTKRSVHLTDSNQQLCYYLKKYQMRTKTKNIRRASVERVIANKTYA